jgi:hypothetical protein
VLLASLGKIQIDQNLHFAAGNKIRKKKNSVCLATPFNDPVENCPLSGTVDIDIQSKSEFRQVVIETVPSCRVILAQRGRLMGWIGQGKLV